MTCGLLWWWWWCHRPQPPKPQPCPPKPPPPCPDPCFLPGTMLATDQRDKSIEQFKVGDLIKTYDWRTNSSFYKPVIWVGKRQAKIDRSLPDDQAGYPVRILANAFSTGLPYKDMLVTAEHCLFFNNSFVPARMLINGRSIFYDKSFSAYEYYHIETQEHSVIVADGTLTESYLNTGNHASFQQEGKIVSLPNQTRPKTWEDDAAAPLIVDRDKVEPLHAQFTNKAIEAGIESKIAEPELTHDPDLHLITESGHVIRKIREKDGSIVFMVPPDVSTVRLVSRVSRPVDTIGPYVDDRRQLGVLVSDITFFEGGKTRSITEHLKNPDLTGWNPSEQDTSRWSSGNAVLPLGPRRPRSIGMLAVKVLTSGPYLIEQEPEHAAPVRA
ncbi:MAG: Hint domain-containing protein [Acetobacter orientalis]|uniref:Hint domain-containing protein n=1 Tax=Acetobacter orientalis TaxID=146474 RepID=UPI0039EA812C